MGSALAENIIGRNLFFIYILTWACESDFYNSKSLNFLNLQSQILLQNALVVMNFVSRVPLVEIRIRI